MLGLDADSSLQVLTTARDRNGTTHYRYQQTYRGVPIFGEHVVVSEDSHGTVRNLFGRAVNGLGFDLGARTNAGLSQTQALAIVKSLVLGDAALVDRQSTRLNSSH